MATDLKPTRNMSLTQFCGPVREDGGDRRKLQLTQVGGFEMGWMLPGYVNVTKEEALDLARALLDWVADDREAE